MTVSWPGLPALTWTGDVGHASTAEDSLVLVSEAEVDWFNSPWADSRLHSATALVFTPPAGSFSFSARVSVDGPRSTFDAAVLCLWTDADHWAKLCFEFSPTGRAMVVSVVTTDWSDDANADVVEDPEVFLRLSRGEHGWVFHASADGLEWRFIRTFRMPSEAIKVGFLAQAPTGPACTARFADITLTTSAPVDLRNGS